MLGKMDTFFLDTLFRICSTFSSWSGLCNKMQRCRIKTHQHNILNRITYLLTHLPLDYYTKPLYLTQTIHQTQTTVWYIECLHLTQCIYDKLIQLNRYMYFRVFKKHNYWIVNVLNLHFMHFALKLSCAKKQVLKSSSLRCCAMKSKVT